MEEPLDIRVLSCDSMHHLLVRAAEVVWATANAHEICLRACPDPELLVPHGIFVSLRRAGELAGCVGFPEPRSSVWQLVEGAAHAAAAEDSRFRAIEATDLVQLVVEVSVLTTPVPASVESFEPGHHGLLLRTRRAHALLLPQVAVEHELDRSGFLEALCHKAGVDVGILRESGTTLLAFEAQVECAPYPALVDSTLSRNRGMSM